MREKSQKLQGYVSQDNYNTFLRFKEGKGVTSDSQALNILIETFLGNPTYSESMDRDQLDKRIYLALMPIVRRLETIESKLNLQDNLQNNLNNNSQDNLQDDLEDNLESNPINGLSNFTSRPIGNLENNLETDTHNNPESNLNINLQDDKQVELQVNLENDLNSNLQDEIENNLESNLQKTSENNETHITTQPATRDHPSQDETEQDETAGEQVEQLTLSAKIEAKDVTPKKSSARRKKLKN